MSTDHPSEEGEASPGGYRPLMPEERAERIRQWHNSTYREARAVADCDQTFSYLGRILVVSPQVMPITPVSHLVGEAVLTEIKDGDRVRDMGTGSGVDVILASSKATEVLAMDINPHSLEPARNKALHTVSPLGRGAPRDVFSNVEGAFEMIVFDPPSRWFACAIRLKPPPQRRTTAAMIGFFRQSRRHLADGGRMMIFFRTLHRHLGSCATGRRHSRPAGRGSARRGRRAGPRRGSPRRRA